MEKAAEIQRKRRLHWAAEDERWERERQAREAERQRQEEERRKLEELKRLALDWETAERVKSFLRVVDRVVPSWERKPAFQAWLEWAQKAVAELDPITRATRTPKLP